MNFCADGEPALNGRSLDKLIGFSEVNNESW